MMTGDIKDLVLVCNTKTCSESTCPKSSIGGRVGIGVDVAKQAGRVGSIGFAGQIGYGSKWVIFKRVNRVAGQVGLTCIFQQQKISITKTNQ